MTNRSQNGSDSVGTNLQHYGIKGMRWGVRRSPKQLEKARAKQAKAEAAERAKVPASEDAAKAIATIERIKAGGPSAVSNADLKQLVDRMNLEMNYGNMVAKEAKYRKENSNLAKGKRLVDDVLSYGDTANKAIRFSQSPFVKVLGGKSLAEAVKSDEQLKKEKKEAEKKAEEES